MKIFLGIIIVIHGLIHLLGFVKAFEFSEIQQLAKPISKPMGIGWLSACVVFLIAALLFAFQSNYWWLFGSIAVVISQVLIIYFWQDAKFGTIANVIILIASIIGYSSWSYHETYRTDIQTALYHNKNYENSILTESDIQQLPECIKKYICYSGSIGKPKVHNFKLEFTGKIRKNEQSEWMPFTSEQYNFMQPPTRLFFMKAVMNQLPVSGYHRYRNGNAMMDIRLLSLFNVQYQEGAKMDTAETVTFFNDMCCMAPATLIDKRIQWLETDENTVKASFTNNHITIVAWLYFNDKGELINFISDDRYAADADKKLRWATPIKNYKEINGYRLAGYAEVIYTYPDRDLCYGTFELNSVAYNCNNIE
jgi:hypothetical protein